MSTQLLGCAIFLVFVVGLVKLWWSRRRLGRLELIDAEKRLHVREMQKSGIDANNQDVPFGARAIQSGVEVEGIWISRPEGGDDKHGSLSTLVDEDHGQHDWAKYKDDPSRGGWESPRQPYAGDDDGFERAVGAEVVEIPPVPVNVAGAGTYRPRQLSQRPVSEWDEANALHALEGAAPRAGPGPQTYVPSRPGRPSALASLQKVDPEPVPPPAQRQPARHPAETATGAGMGRSLTQQAQQQRRRSDSPTYTVDDDHRSSFTSEVHSPDLSASPSAETPGSGSHHSAPADLTNPFATPARTPELEASALFGGGSTAGNTATGTALTTSRPTFNTTVHFNVPSRLVTRRSGVVPEEPFEDDMGFRTVDINGGSRSMQTG